MGQGFVPLLIYFLVIKSGHFPQVVLVLILQVDLLQVWFEVQTFDTISNSTEKLMFGVCCEFCVGCVGGGVYHYDVLLGCECRFVTGCIVI